MPAFEKLFTYTIGSCAAGTAGWLYYTRDCHFVSGFNVNSPEWSSSLIRKLNPPNNPPVLMDHCIRQVKLSELRTTDTSELATRFCAGVWGGSGFRIQKHFLEDWHRKKEGRERHLWNTEELLKSDYPVGTKVADHFEVMARTKGAVVWRCGDSPTVGIERGLPVPRDSDGLFALEVTKDKNKAGEDVATFHMKSIFFNGLSGASPGALPWWFPRAHMEYDKLLMCTSISKLLK